MAGPSSPRGMSAILLLGAVLSILVVAAWFLFGPADEPRPQGPDGPAQEDLETQVTPDPMSRGATRDVVTEGDPDEATDEGDPTPPDFRTTSGPLSGIRILHAGTERHAAQVELRIAARYFAEADHATPGEGEPFHVLATSVDSPIRLQPEVTDEERPRLAALTLSAPRRELTATLGQDPPVLHRGFALYARAPGTAWGRIELDLREPANRTLELPGGQDLELTFENWQPEAYAALGLAPRVRILRQGGSPNEPLSEQGLGTDPAPRPCAVEGIPAGAVLRVLVDLGRRFETEEPIRLADQVVATDPAPAGPVVIALEDPPTGRVVASLRGRLRLPAFPGREDTELRLFGPGSTYREPSASFELAEMQPAGPGVWEFEAEVPAGRVQAKLWPLLTSWVVDVPESGTQAEFAIEAIAEVEVTVIDRRTNRPAEVSELTWRREDLLEGMRNHLADTIRAEAPTSRFVIHTSPGFLELDVDQERPPLMGLMQCEVGSGKQRVDLVVGAPTGVTVRFRLGDSLLPLDAPGLPDLFLLAVGHDGQQTLDSTRVDAGLQVSAPGRYRLSIAFAKDSPYRYAGDEVFVDVVSDQRTPLEIELQRR